MFQILVVEDDKDLNKSVCQYLSQYGYEAKGCLNTEDAYDQLFNESCDLILSDIMMPVTDGFEFAQTIRDINKDIPIIFMSAKDDILSKQRGYRIGIDDYLVKPLDLDELILKIGAVLRRAKISMSKELKIGSLTLNLEERSAVLNGEEVPMTVREFNLLYKLLSYPKKTFSRSQLMNEFWDSESTSGSRTVDVYMTKLRDKFSNCDDFEIITVHGLGYKAVLKNEK